jgi:hypothetical protein
MTALRHVSVVAVCLLAASGSACTSDVSTSGPDTAPTTQAESTWTFDLYFVEMPPVGDDRQPTLFAEPVTVPNTGDKPFDVVDALLATSRTYEARGVNGFNLFFEHPIAEVNSVIVGADVITVDLDREVWDPYPTVDCNCPPGEVVMQQLVWTLDKALDSTLPVLLTINGEPARGIWFHRLDGPVAMAEPEAEPRRARFDPPGIKNGNDVDRPAPSVSFLTTNAWTGWFGGDYLAVYAGDAGYEKPNTGKVMVFTYDDDRTTPLIYSRTVPGTGALRVVAVDKPTVEVEAADGQPYVLDLRSKVFAPA